MRCTLRIRGQDRLDDRIVLAKRVLGLAGHELQRSKRRDPLAEASGYARDTRTVGASINGLVELAVDRCKVILAAFLQATSAARVQHLEPLLLQRRHPDR